MISISGKNWVEKKINKNSIEKTKQDFGLSEIISKLVVSRNFDVDEITGINRNLDVINIFKNTYDFNFSSNLLLNSINKKEKVCILGDYDVDGTTATSLLVKFFNHINQPHFYYIPNREKDGYGATKKLFQKLIKNKPKLVIMVDCGSSSNKAIEFLNENDIKSIIIDHHEIYKPFPKSNSIINPKKNTSHTKYNYFCATALTYFFLDILIQKTKSNFKLSNFLIYVLLATICDVMPLRKINRLIAKNVIKKFDIRDNLAFSILFDQIGINRKITVDDLGYLLGPIINSGGRLGYSNYGTELLTSNDPIVIKKKSIELIKLNNRRKKIEKIILDEIDFKKIKKENENVIIYYKPNLNEGLIGIIAARLKDHFNKPSIVMTNSKNIIKGSARSTDNYNIGSLIKLLLDKKIIEKGGGHNMAAGFTIKKEKLKYLNNFVQKDYLKINKEYKFFPKYDLTLSSLAINNKFMDEINKIGPFGNENRSPLFLIENLKIIKPKLLKEKHVSAILKSSKGSSIKAICFNCADTQIAQYLLNYKKQINIIAEINENNWNSKKLVQLIIKDIILISN